jgi:hypothetical protein
MKFKDYIQESKSKSILQKIRFNYLPISPKFFEEVFGAKEKYCFMAMQKKRIPSLYKRQHKKNQISTFTKWINTDIFWGAEGLNWEGSTIVAVLKGKVTLEGNSDLWTEYDSQGRRWIDVGELKSNSLFQDNLIKTLSKLTLEIRTEFTSDKYYPEFDENIKTNKDKQQYIKDFFDISYKYLKKYKTQLENAIDNVANYNEVLCYDYEIVELLIYDSNLTPLDKTDLNNIKKIKYKTFDNINELENYLKKYQKD